MAPDVDNPYAPSDLEVFAPAATVDGESWSPADWGRRFLRWLVIVSVAALTSFLWGINVTEFRSEAIAAMLGGILIFAIFYTMLDGRHLRHVMARDYRARRAILIGFGIRLAASVLIPVGMAIDVLPGSMAVGIAGSVTQAIFDGPPTHVPSMAVFALTATIFQGAILNVGLWLMVLVFYAAQVLMGTSPVAPWQQHDLEPSQLRIH